MAEPTPGDPIPLSDALVRWTNPALVAAVRAEERRHLPYHLGEFYRLSAARLRLSPDADLRKPSPGAGWAGPPDMGGLLSAWRALERDLRVRLVHGEFHLLGVRAAPVRDEDRSPLPGLWAADFEFDFYAERVGVDRHAWTAVVAVRGPAPSRQTAAPSVGEGAPRSLPPITAEGVRDLTDEEVLLLLEEHARRVVEFDEFQALDPGITKVSFMPIILRKMRARAEAGAMFDTLSAEAAELERWIQDKAPSHQTPTAGAIENALRIEYKRLKA